MNIMSSINKNVDHQNSGPNSSNPAHLLVRESLHIPHSQARPINPTTAATDAAFGTAFGIAAPVAKRLVA
jgi:hypothetical protein